jgi:hypothetical protein
MKRPSQSALLQLVFILARNMTFSLLVAPLMLVGCGNLSDEIHDVDDPESKADGVTRPLGSYVDPTHIDANGKRVAMVLFSDSRYWIKTYTYARDFEEEGSYKFTRYEDTRYVRFTTDQGSVHRAEYILSGETLELDDADAGWEALMLTHLLWGAPQCRGPYHPEDCYKQGVEAPPNGWYCGTELLCRENW